MPVDLGDLPKPPPPCPKCKSEWVAKIAYGYDSASPMFVEGLRRGEIVLGSSTFDKELRMVPRAWHCRSCDHEWGKPSS